MKGRRYGKQVMRRLLTGLFGVAAGLVAAAQPAFSEEGTPASSEQMQPGSGTSVSPSPAEAPAGIPEGAAGLTVHIDPQTGKILRERAPNTVPLQLSPREQNSLNTSHEGLVQVPNSAPGGGVKLDLKGRFQSPLVVTIDANGKTKIEHLSEMPGHSE
ncbi:MAG: hypothetical protein QOD40_1276 [Alphaproteobacteria bacterium]|nr:hypothetical protein [Alphaproteobacteria bacterium]MEA2992356.1 hypothetical protein [Alphaproteobacteria bacterium]